MRADSHYSAIPDGDTPISSDRRVVGLGNLGKLGTPEVDAQIGVVLDASSFGPTLALSGRAVRVGNHFFRTVLMRLRRFRPWCSISTLAITMSVASPASLSAQDLQQAFILQGFVSPTSDPFLAGLSFGEIGFAANTMGFDLRLFDGTFLSGPSLFYFFDPGAHPFSSYFLPTNVLLAPNTLYAIVLESNPSGGFAGASGSGPGSVPNGLLALPTVPHDGSGSWARVGDDMRGFNASFTTVTPEPSTLMLLAPVMIGLVFGMRHPAKKRKSLAS